MITLTGRFSRVSLRSSHLCHELLAPLASLRHVLVEVHSSGAGAGAQRPRACGVHLHQHVAQLRGQVKVLGGHLDILPHATAVVVHVAEMQLLVHPVLLDSLLELVEGLVKVHLHPLAVEVHQAQPRLAHRVVQGDRVTGIGRLLEIVEGIGVVHVNGARPGS